MTRSLTQHQLAPRSEPHSPATPPQPAAKPRPVEHPPSRPVTRSLTQHQLAPRSETRSAATLAGTQAGQPPRRSARIKARVCAVENRPQPAAPQLLRYEQCIGFREGPHTFSSLVLEDLHTGHKENLGDTQQLLAALPRSLDPSSRLTLIAQVAPPGQRCLPQAMRASLRWLLPSDGEFQSGPDGQRYYLARQGRRVVLRGGDVRAPLANSRINWVYDSPPSQSHHIAPRQNAPKSNTKVPNHRDKAVCKNHENGPRNGPNPRSTLESGDVRVRAPLDNMSASASRSYPLSFRENNCPPVPRNNRTDRQTDIQKHVSPRPKKKRINYKRRERRARERSAIERAERGEMFNHNAWWATQSSGAPPSPIVPDQLTESGLLHSDPISAMRPAVYPPVTLEGRLSANDNSSFQFDQELGESAGLYKPAVPDPQHHTWAYTSAATSAKPGPPSPTRNLAATSAGRRNGTGIIYPLQPRSLQPDVCIEVEATLPEPAALRRPDLQQQPTREAPTSLSRPSRRHCRKRRRNRSTAIYRPARTLTSTGALV